MIFDCHNYFEDKKVKLFVMEFINYEVIWWNYLVLNRKRNHKGSIETWDEMNVVIRKKIVLSHYYKELYHKFQSLIEVLRA